jgi:hypothetical protein
MRRLVAERRIPIVKVGRLIRFDAHQVEHWVDEHRVDVVEATAALRRDRMRRLDTRRAG